MNEEYEDQFDPEDFLTDDVSAAEDDLDAAPICAVCGCSQFDPCPGGCIWATENLCSRCV